MKQTKATFSQKGEKREVSETQVNDAFDILITEVMKCVKKRKLHKSFNNNVSVKGGDYIWAS